MSLEKLAARGEAIGSDAVERVRGRLTAQTNPPPGVAIAATPQGIELSGKRLRHRFITDPDLTNFAR